MQAGSSSAIAINNSNTSTTAQPPVNRQLFNADFSQAIISNTTIKPMLPGAPVWFPDIRDRQVMANSSIGESTLFASVFPDVKLADISQPLINHAHSALPYLPYIDTRQTLSRYLNQSHYINHALPVLQHALERSKHPEHRQTASKINDITNQKSAIQKHLKHTADNALTRFAASYDLTALHLDDAQFRQLLSNIDAICDSDEPEARLLEIFTEIENYKNSAIVDQDGKKLWLTLYSDKALNNHLIKNEFGQNIQQSIRKIIYRAYENEATDTSAFTTEYHEILNKIQALCVSRDKIKLHKLCDLDLAGKSNPDIVRHLLDNEAVTAILKLSDYGRQLLGALLSYPPSFEIIKHNQFLADIDSKIAVQNKQLDKIKQYHPVRKMLSFVNTRIMHQNIHHLIKTKRRENLFWRDKVLGKHQVSASLQNICGAVDANLAELSYKDSSVQNIVCNAINLNESAAKVTPLLLGDATQCASFIEAVAKLTIYEKLCDYLKLPTNKFLSAITHYYSDIAQLVPAFRLFKVDPEQQALILATGLLLPASLSQQQRNKEILTLVKFHHSPAIFSPECGDIPIEGYLTDVDIWRDATFSSLSSEQRKDIIAVCLQDKSANSFYMQLESSLNSAFAFNLLAQRLSKGIALDHNENDQWIGKLVNTAPRGLVLKDVKAQIMQAMNNYMLSQGEYFHNRTRESTFKLEIARIFGLLAENFIADLNKAGINEEHIKIYHNDISKSLVNTAIISGSDHLSVLDMAFDNLIAVRDSLCELESFFGNDRRFFSEKVIIRWLTEMMDKTLFNDAQHITLFHHQVDVLFSREIIKYYIEGKFRDSQYYADDNGQAERIAQELHKMHKSLKSFSSTAIDDLIVKIESVGIKFTDDGKNHLLQELHHVLFHNYHTADNTSHALISLILHKIFGHSEVADTQRIVNNSTRHQLLAALTQNLTRQMSELVNKEIKKTLDPFTSPALRGLKNQNNINVACKLISSVSSRQSIVKTITAFINNPAYNNSPETLSNEESAELHVALRDCLANDFEGFADIIKEFIKKMDKLRKQHQIKMLSLAVSEHRYLHSARQRLTVTQNPQQAETVEAEISLKASQSCDQKFSDQLKPGKDNHAHKPDAQRFIQEVDRKNGISESVFYKTTQLQPKLTHAIAEFNAEIQKENKKVFTEAVIVAGMSALAANHLSGEINHANDGLIKKNMDSINQTEKDVSEKNKYIQRENEKRRIEEDFLARSITREYQNLNKSLIKQHELKKAVRNKTTRYLEHLQGEMPAYLIYEEKGQNIRTRVVIRDGREKVTQHHTIDGERENDKESRFRYNVAIKRREFSRETIKEVEELVQHKLIEAKADKSNEPGRKTWFDSEHQAPDVENCKLKKVITEHVTPAEVHYVGVETNYNKLLPQNKKLFQSDLDRVNKKLVDEYLNHPNIETPGSKIHRAPALAIDYAGPSLPLPASELGTSRLPQSAALLPPGSTPFKSYNHPSAPDSSHLITITAEVHQPPSDDLASFSRHDISTSAAVMGNISTVPSAARWKPNLRQFSNTLKNRFKM